MHFYEQGSLSTKSLDIVHTLLSCLGPLLYNVNLFLIFIIYYFEEKSIVNI